MTKNGEGRPIVEPGHVLDAFIVAMIVFMSVLGGDALMNVASGETVLLTIEDVARRLVTAGIAFGLTFFFQWARYRGIQVAVKVPVIDGGEKND